MKTRSALCVSGISVALMIVAACGGTDAARVNAPTDTAASSSASPPEASAPALPTSPPSSPTADTATPPASAAPSVASGPTAGVSERMGAPLVLKLRGPDPVPPKGDIKLTLEIVANEPIIAPVTIKISLPAGAKLTAGKAEEVMQIKQAGSSTREFQVHTDAALTAPVVVTADAKDPSGAFGLHAKREYPSAQPASLPPASTGPRPPVPRPSGPPTSAPPKR
jgi:hypothetical protein